MTLCYKTSVKPEMFIHRKNFPVINKRPQNLKVAVQLIRMILFDTVFLLLLSCIMVHQIWVSFMLNGMQMC